MNYFISDLHLGHKNVIGFDRRPFFDLQDMHASIIKNWNDVVTAKDTVYILGDVAWKDDTALAILPQLKGKKVLILGNHDNRLNKSLALFESVHPYLELNRDGEFLVLSHYPMHVWNRSRYGAVHLYGHVHNNHEQDIILQHNEIMKVETLEHECYNVGCMMPYMGYTPRTLSEIRLRFKKYMQNRKE